MIPLRDLFWPFKLFYYIMPFSYYIRSAMYNSLHDTTWEYCNRADNPGQPVCVTPPTGDLVLEAIGKTYPIIENNDQIVKDLGIMLAIAAFWKLCYIVGVVVKTSKSSKIL